MSVVCKLFNCFCPLFISENVHVLKKYLTHNDLRIWRGGVNN